MSYLCFFLRSEPRLPFLSCLLERVYMSRHGPTLVAGLVACGLIFLAVVAVPVFALEADKVGLAAISPATVRCLLALVALACQRW